MLCILMYKHNHQWEHRPNGLLQQRHAIGNAGPKVLINTVLCQRERRPKGLQQHNAKGNACSEVFHNTMPKGTPAEWSFTIQCRSEHRPNGLYNTMPKRTLVEWSFIIQCQREHQPSGLLQHNAIGITSPGVFYYVYSIEGLPSRTCPLV